MKLPFTLRLAYYGFRATIRAGLLFLCAWIFLLPASTADNIALGAREDAQYPAGLRMMRVAQVIVTAAPPQAYDLIAIGLRREISPLMVRIAFTQMAAGHVMPPSTRGSSVPARNSDRDIQGPRFIKVD